MSAREARAVARDAVREARAAAALAADQEVMDDHHKAIRERANHFRPCVQMQPGEKQYAKPKLWVFKDGEYVEIP